MVSEPRRLNVEIFGFDIAEASQIRRIRTILSLGHNVHSFTMRRGNMNTGFQADWPNTHLFNTANEKLWRRVAVIGASVVKMIGHRARLRSADVLVARNLDMLAIAALARWIANARHVPLIYECLDIHGALCGRGLKARMMRWMERRLLARVQMLAVSSPGFIRNYFKPVQGYTGSWTLWENKLAAGVALPPRPRHRVMPAFDHSLRIGWVGTIRCAPSLLILSDLARRMGDRIEIEIHGVVHRHVLPDFDDIIASCPNMTYHGAYDYPADLAKVYTGIDLVWTQDLWQPGTNSDWLLPNRIYEASWAGCPSIAVAGTETGHRVSRDALGWVVDAANADAVQSLLEELDRRQIAECGQSLLTRAAQEFVQSPLEIADTLDAVCMRDDGPRLTTSVQDPQVDPATILVAIPTLNEEQHIAATLQSLFDGSAGLERAKIVVADGGSTDATRRIVARFATRYPNVHLIDNPARLQAAAVNLIVETQAEPRHDILVRIDAHATYPPGYVLSVAKSLLSRETEAVATVLDSGGNTGFQRGAAWAAETRLGSGGSGHRGGMNSGFVAHGHHAGFRLATFRGLGGYDITFTTNEDAEFDHRLGLQGGRIWLDASIRVGYIMRRTLRGLSLQYWRYGKGRAQTVRTHRMRPQWRQMIPPAALAVNLATLILAPWAPALLILPLFYGLVLLTTTGALVLRHRKPCAFWAGPALFSMHMFWGAGFWYQFLFFDRMKHEN